MIRVKEVHGRCPVFKVGDEMVLDGPKIVLEKTDAVCVHALSCLSTFVVALDEGIPPEKLGLAKKGVKTAYFQCLDPGEPYTDGGTVIFEVKRSA